MPKGKAKKPAKLSRQDITDAQVSALNERIESLESEVDELEEAICPRVAARLLALERAIGTAKPAGPSVVQPGSKIGRSPCTDAQIDAVARKLNAVLGYTGWHLIQAEDRVKLRRKAHEIIHIVQSVMG